jgi:hypothetical protein
MKFHPNSGPSEYHSAADLERAMGDEIRTHYGGMAGRMLVTCLKQRLKSVIICRQVARTWSDEYASKSQASSSASSSVCLRRTAARTGFVLKRPAAVAGITDEPTSKRQPKAEAMELNGYKAIEDTCGLGIGWRKAEVSH